MLDVDKLRACPFCGGEAHMCFSKDESLWSHNIVDWARVGCMDCDASVGNFCDDGEHTAAYSAAKAWNTRRKRRAA